jgi:hypothetical protein
MTFMRAVAVAILVSAIGVSHVRFVESSDQKSVSEKCPADPDPRYPRQRILDQFANILKQSIPPDAKYYGLLNTDWEGKNLRFFVYDLTDPDNIYSDVKAKQSKKALCVNFVDNHVYHFSPFFIPYSFNHIGFLQNGELKVFRLLNCEGKGDSLNDVVNYLDEKLKGDAEKDNVIGRVKEYRKFGDYFTIDDTWVRCEEARVGARQ